MKNVLTEPLTQLRDALPLVDRWSLYNLLSAVQQERRKWRLEEHRWAKRRMQATIAERAMFADLVMRERLIMRALASRLVEARRQIAGMSRQQIVTRIMELQQRINEKGKGWSDGALRDVLRLQACLQSEMTRRYKHTAEDKAAFAKMIEDQRPRNRVAVSGLRSASAAADGTPTPRGSSGGGTGS